MTTIVTALAYQYGHRNPPWMQHQPYHTIIHTCETLDICLILRLIALIPCIGLRTKILKRTRITYNQAISTHIMIHSLQLVMYQHLYQVTEVRFQINTMIHIIMREAVDIHPLVKML